MVSSLTPYLPEYIEMTAHIWSTNKKDDLEMFVSYSQISYCLIYCEETEQRGERWRTPSFITPAGSEELHTPKSEPWSSMRVTFIPLTKFCDVVKLYQHGNKLETKTSPATAQNSGTSLFTEAQGTLQNIDIFGFWNILNIEVLQSYIKGLKNL